MKKIVVILLMVAYGVTSFGTTIHLQYCMNKLVSYSAVSKQTMCGGMQNGKCCKHEYKQVKVENHYKDAVSTFDYNTFTTVANTIYPYQITDNPTAIPLTNTYFKQTYRRRTNQKIFVFNCVYRI